MAISAMATGCSAVQPAPACAVGRADVSTYAVSYTLNAGSPACASGREDSFQDGRRDSLLRKKVIIS